MTLNSCRKGLSKATVHTARLMGELLGHKVVLEQLTDFKIEKMAPHDDYSDASPGYWFGDGPLPAAVDECIDRRLVHDMIFDTRTKAGVPRVDTAKLVKFIETADEVSDHLFFLLQTTGGQPARLPRLSYCLIKNLVTAPRGVFIRHGRVFIQGHWDKNRGQGADSPSGVRFVDRTTSALLLLYILFVRPLYDLAIARYRDATGEQEQSMTDKCLLLQWRGGQAKSDRLGRVFKAYFTKYFGTETIGVAAWRHINKALVRKFLPDRFAKVVCPASDLDAEDESEEDMESIWADIAAHSVRTARRVYGRLVEQSKLEAKLQACTAYHVLLGLEPSPEPRTAGPRNGAAPEVKREGTYHQMLTAFQSPQFHDVLVRAHVTTQIAAPALHPVQAPTSAGLTDAAQAFGPYPLLPSMEGTKMYTQQLRSVLGPRTNFRSPNQLMLLHALVTSPGDCLAVVRVGGGKSTLLIVAAKVRKLRDR